MNRLAGAFNDVAISPDTSLAALNRLIPPMVKIMAGTSFSAKLQLDQLVLGAIPDIGYMGDPGLHGPKRYDWEKLVGSVKYTLWRLQERVVGQGPAVQIPTNSIPTEPGLTVSAPTDSSPAVGTPGSPPRAPQ